MRKLIGTLIVIGAALAPLAPVQAKPAPKIAEGCPPPIVHAAAPFGRTSCPGVRPGALVEVPATDGFCTLGFVYSANGRYYITTAGHCVLEEPGGKVWAPGTGPVVYDGAGKAFGRFVYAALSEDPVGQIGIKDIGLILVSTGFPLKAQMCHFGGPTAAFGSGSNQSAFRLYHYGSGLGFGDVTPARTGATLGTGGDKYQFLAFMPSFFGDSGGPVITQTGKAIGFVTGFASGFDARGSMPNTGITLVKRMDAQLAYAKAATKLPLTLRTASLIP